MKKAFFAFLMATSVPAVLWASEVPQIPLWSPQALENQIDALSTQDSSGQFSAFFYEYECIARNERGEYFSGRSHFPRKAEEIAMAKCYHRSHSCVMQGCHPF